MGHAVHRERDRRANQMIRWMPREEREWKDHQGRPKVVGDIEGKAER